MTPAVRTRVAIVLTAGVLLGILAAAILLLLNGYRHPGPVVRGLTLGTNNGHEYASWTLSARRPVELRITASDPTYCSTWPEEGVRKGKHWDQISVTVGARDGSFFWEFRTQTSAQQASLGGSGGERVKSLLFANLQRRGYAPPGTVLGTFMLEKENGKRIDGKISLIEVTQQAPHLVRNQTGTEEPNKKPD